MRQKLGCLLLTGALALSLCACAPGDEAASDTPAPAPSAQPAESAPALSIPPTQEPSLSVPPSQVPADSLAAAYGIPDREYLPWQEAYMAFLTGLQRAEQGNLDIFFEHGPYFDTSEERPDGRVGYEGLAVDDRGCYVEGMDGIMPLTQVMELGSETYSLYDVDRDGVPELFVSYGGWTTQCYTCRDGQVVCIGEFHSKDSSLYSHPEHHSVLLHWGRMGHYELYEYPMEGGRLAEGQEIFSEGPVDAWTETEDIVPGAEAVPYYYTRLGDWQRLYATYIPEDEYLVDDRPHPSAGKALLLPICDASGGHFATGDSSETARAAILAVLDGEGELYGASGDHFYGDVGWMSWEEYIQPEAAYPYNDEPLEPTRHVWLDMNGDGQEELLLQVVTGRGEDNGEPWASESTVVFSEQDGTVYAYFFGFWEKADAFFDDGTVLDIYGKDCRISFWKGQCYEYPRQRDAAAQGVKWVDGLPVG